MLSVFTILLLLRPTAFPSGAPQSSGMSRPCAASWNAPTPDTKKKRPKNAAKESESATACIELSFSPLEIQEYVQSYSRNQHWTILEEHTGEDSWTVSLALTKDELLGATKGDSSCEKVEWRSGIALVQIRSTPLAEGFTRTVVRANFRGYGESADKFAMQREYWELPSNGSFEASVVSALKAHFKAAP